MKTTGSVTMEKLFPSGMYLVILYDYQGLIHDKVRCDSYRTACEYKKAFRAIARNI